MNCVNCALPLDASRSGFIVCPKCGYVNVRGITSGPANARPATPSATPPASHAPTAVSQLPHAAAFPQPRLIVQPEQVPLPVKPSNATKTYTRNKSSTRRHRKLLVSISAVVFIIIGVVGGLGYYQNSKANSLLQQAQDNISRQHYDQALSELNKANTYYSTSRTKQQIAGYIQEVKKLQAGPQAF